jgi:hypothetical protein
MVSTRTRGSPSPSPRSEIVVRDDNSPRCSPIPSRPVSPKLPSTFHTSMHDRLDGLQHTLTTLLERFVQLQSPTQTSTPMPSSLPSITLSSPSTADQVAQGPNLPTSTVAPSSRRRPIFSKFDGSRSRTRDFLTDMEMQTRGMKNEDKIAEVYCFLEGRAYKWMSGKIRQQTKTGIPLRLLRDWPFFVEEFTRYFSPINRELEGRQKLAKIKHGKSIHEFRSDFDEVREILSWSDAPICAFVMSKLRPEHKRQLYAYQHLFDMSNYEELMKYVLLVDSNMQEVEMDEDISHPRVSPQPQKDFRSSKSFNLPRSFRPRNKRPYSSFTKASPVVEFSVPQKRSASDVTGAEPPQKKFKKGRLTKEERERRYREGLCVYCGEAGHLVNNCPQLNKSSKSQALASLTVVPAQSKNSKTQ